MRKEQQEEIQRKEKSQFEIKKKAIQ